mgnify:CR=1 FL=1
MVQIRKRAAGRGEGVEPHREAGRVSGPAGRQRNGKDHQPEAVVRTPEALPSEVRLAGSVGVLPQNPQALFVKKTVREDLFEILKGRNFSGKAQEERVAWAVRLCRLEGLLDRHPYDLSGGEQQRIAIARAVLKNAPILILDEATAFCPTPNNEVRVQQALSVLSKKKTVIMIAHRLSSITGADCIYVMQDGEIVESGTHNELIERNGIFTRMWKNYSEAAEWKIAKEVSL